MYGVGKKVIEIWAILSYDKTRPACIVHVLYCCKLLGVLDSVKPFKFHENCLYLDNFLTNPMHILVYLSLSGPKSPEYVKIW